MVDKRNLTEWEIDEQSLATISDETLLAHDQRYDKGAVSPPIYQSSLFSFANYEHMLSRFRGDSDEALYSRVDNPTVAVFEKKMASLERGDEAIAFASGMAAISNAILSVVRAGDQILCIDHVYPDAYRFLRGFCQRFAIEVKFVDANDLSAVEKGLRDSALFYLESPNSWLMQQQDLTRISEMAKAANVVTIVDNSWATPLFQKPLTQGIDIVVHSASKYISGHSDTVAGVVVAKQFFIDQIRQNISPFLGAKLSANEAWLLTRGLRTLPLRMERHHSSGLHIAKSLDEHSLVRKVYHPALEGEGFSSLTGFGSLFSFELDSSVDIATFCDALTIFRLGVSWGGYESLIIPAQAVVDQAGEFNSAQDFGVSSRIVRLFIGLENPDELWADLRTALDCAVSC